MTLRSIAFMPLLLVSFIPEAPHLVASHDKPDPLVRALDFHSHLGDFVAKREAAAERRAEAAEASRDTARSEISASGLPHPWDDLAACESGGNPAAVNPSGPYYGLFQFLQSTWESVGGTGLPSQASVAEQLKRAQILQARSGWGQWPVCAAGF